MTSAVQAPSAVVMIRPHHFISNPQTMQDNAFQQHCSDMHPSERAYMEVTQAVQQLELEGVKVHLFEDMTTATPDSVFPNNWFSTHSDGQIITYPMYAPNRRLEVRQDIIDFLAANYQVKQQHDYSHLAAAEVFLEGTGSLVIDHAHGIAYAVESKRTNRQLVEIICQQLGLDAMVFNAFDDNNMPVYHTNVLMCVATEFVMLCLDMVPPSQQAKLLAQFEQHGLQGISLSAEQIKQFCGNAIELQGSSGRVLALSTTAFAALSEAQKTQIAASAKLLPIHIPTIESAGGSVRCMLAGIHLQQK